MTYGFNHHLNMPIFAALLLLMCFFTCTNTKEPMEYDAAPAYIVPFTEFDSLLSCAEIELDSETIAFNAKLEQAKKDNVPVIYSKKPDSRQPEQDTTLISRRKE